LTAHEVRAGATRLRAVRARLDRIALYRKQMSREGAVAQKRAALAAAPDFAQRLSEIEVAPAAGGGAVATFVKQSGSGQKASSVRGQLTVEVRGSSYAIVVESDAPTDALTAPATTCLGAAMEVAQALPEVKKEFAEADPDARQGGVTYSEEGNSASAALGFQHDDRFESVIEIDVVDGVLEVKKYGVPLAVPAKEVERVRKQVRRAAEVDAFE
jgi:hypothetical protein